MQIVGFPMRRLIFCVPFAQNIGRVYTLEPPRLAEHKKQCMPIHTTVLREKLICNYQANLESSTIVQGFPFGFPGFIKKKTANTCNISRTFHRKKWQLQFNNLNHGFIQCDSVKQRPTKLNYYRNIVLMIVECLHQENMSV